MSQDVPYKPKIDYDAFWASTLAAELAKHRQTFTKMGRERCAPRTVEPDDELYQHCVGIADRAVESLLKRNHVRQTAKCFHGWREVPDPISNNWLDLVNDDGYYMTVSRYGDIAASLYGPNRGHTIQKVVWYGTKEASDEYRWALTARWATQFIALTMPPAEQEVHAHEAFDASPEDLPGPNLPKK